MTYRPDAYWFGESQSRVVVSVSKENRNDFNMLLSKDGDDRYLPGHGYIRRIRINGEDWGNVNEWKDKYENAIANLLAGHESEHALTAL